MMHGFKQRTSRVEGSWDTGDEEHELGVIGRSKHGFGVKENVPQKVALGSFRERSTTSNAQRVTHHPTSPRSYVNLTYPPIPFPVTQLGIMTTEERIDATLASGVEAGQSAREYLAFAAAQRRAMGLEDVSGLGKALDEALVSVEKQSGKPLMMEDAAGMKAFYGKVEGVVASAGLDGDLVAESMVADAEHEIKHLKAELGKNK